MLLAQTLYSGKQAQWEHRMAQGLPSREKIVPPKGLWYSSFGHLDTGIWLPSLLLLFQLLEHQIFTILQL